MQVRRRFAALFAAALVAGLFTAAQPAQALPPGAVTLPVAEDPLLKQTTTLLGANTDRLLLQTEAWNGPRYWTGDTNLVAAPTMAWNAVLVGDTAVWPDLVNGRPRQVHRRDLVTGAEMVEDVGADRFLTAGPGG